MTDRHALILEMHAAGWSTVEIAAEVGLSRQRVWQILHREQVHRIIRAANDKP